MLLALGILNNNRDNNNLC